jgi:hypothetical protein
MDHGEEERRNQRGRNPDYRGKRDQTQVLPT